MTTMTGRYANGSTGVGLNSGRSDESYWSSYAVNSQNEVSP